MEGTTPARIRCYAFAPFIIDLGKRQLWRDGQQIPLTAKTFDVLAFLVGNRHRAVTKDEFFTHVWPDSIVLEANLVRQISLIRRALHQRPDEHDYIVTLPGTGYQFVADVTELTTLPIELNHDPHGHDLHGDNGVGQALPGSGEPHVHPELLAAAPQPTDSSGPRRRWLSVTLRGAAMTLAVLGIAWYFLRPEPSESSAPTLRRFTFDSAYPREPTWSPDGRALAYTSDRSGNSDIWLQSLSDPTPVRVTTGEAQDWQPNWSPVSDEIVFRSEADGGGLFVVSARGGTPRRLTNFGSHPRWSPDGRLILFAGPIVRTGPRWLFVTDGNGHAPREIAVDWMRKLREVPGSNSVRAAWDPNGHVSLWGRFAPTQWSFLTVNPSDGTVRAVDIPIAVQQRLESLGLILGNFVWSPSGNSLYFEGRQQEARSLWRVGVDPKTNEWISGPDRLSLGTTDDVDVALSPDGTRVAFTSQTTQTRVWQVPFDSTTGQLTGLAEPVTPGNAHDRDVDVSDDGRQLAYRTQRGEREEIWAYSLPERRERLLLASTTGRRTSPLWSPDGTELLYARRTPNGKAGVDHSLAILRTSLGEERVVPMPHKMGIDPRDWSHDGQTIVGQCRDGSMTTLGTCLVSLSEPSRPADVKVIAYDPAVSLFCQQFSPDQRWVSFLAADPRNFSVSRVYIVPVGGGQWIPVTDGTVYEDKPRWAPDGRTLYFVSSRSGSLNVWGRRIDPSTGMPVGEVFPVTQYESKRFGLSPELGQMEIAVTRDRLFLPLAERSGAIWLLENLEP